MARHLITNIAGFSEVSATRLIDAMNRAFPYAEVMPSAKDYERLTDVALPDKDDRHVIAAALAGAATILCTANVKDFPEAVMTNSGIDVQTPDEFLGSSVNRYPTMMVGVLGTTVANLRGATSESTLAALRCAGAPVTADRLERAL